MHSIIIGEVHNSTLECYYSPWPCTVITSHLSTLCSCMLSASQQHSFWRPLPIMITEIALCHRWTSVITRPFVSEVLLGYTGWGGISVQASRKRLLSLPKQSRKLAVRTEHGLFHHSHKHPTQSRGCCTVRLYYVWCSSLVYHSIWLHLTGQYLSGISQGTLEILSKSEALSIKQIHVIQK